MKGLIFYTRDDDFEKINKVLLSNEHIQGISYFDISGRGKIKRQEKEEIVHVYKTGKKYTPEYENRKRFEVVVPDSETQNIINDIKQSGDIHGKVFIYSIDDEMDLP
ncbi:MAG: P-II family nitrogen regulator [Nitrososphaeraceae archaeon]